MSPQEKATQLLNRMHWVFDLDGTLTKPVHDFPAIRLALGLSEQQGTLEGILGMPEVERKSTMDQLDQIGWDYAEQAEAQPGSMKLLKYLQAHGCRMGVVTRNNHLNLLESLKRCGMEKFFESDCLVSRDQPPAKPSPEPLNRLLQHWGASPKDGVMVGDAVYDLQSGRAAGMATIYLDSSDHGGLEDLADLRVCSWIEFLKLSSLS